MGAGTRRYGKIPDNARAIAREKAREAAKISPEPEIKEETVGGTLHAGPWAGEFGWELCSWNPRVRKMAEKFDRVVVEGPASSEYLYEFADEYIANDPQPNTSDGYSGVPQKTALYEQGATIFKPHWNLMGRPEMRALKRPYKPNPDLSWHCFAPENPAAVADVLCAFRPVKKYRGRVLADKEYPIKLCTQAVGELLACGLSVACIGGDDNYHIPGTEDLRGKPLAEQCSAIAGAKVVIGPSSGPMHLASLCRTPHVVWYNRPDQTSSYARYRDHWNPFNTPHTYLKQQVPTPVEIAEAAALISLEKHDSDYEDEERNL
jgi:hypothetical protein